MFLNLFIFFLCSVFLKCASTCYKNNFWGEGGVTIKVLLESFNKIKYGLVKNSPDCLF